MPGRRLTRAERRRIGEGLARGLEYAAIARALGRPASTVMREVARNGGPGRYHAEMAHLAASHRARRRPRPVAGPIEEHTGHAPHAKVVFVTEFSAALVETGLSRTAAGVLAWLYASESGSCTAAELAQRLKVSAASVSQAAAFLERHALIRRGRDGRGRRHRYFLDDETSFRAVMVGVRANRRLAATALHGADAFGADTVAGARLATTGRLLERLGSDFTRCVVRCWPDAADEAREFSRSSS